MASLILTLLGWNRPSDKLLEKFDNPRLVMVVSHTSRIDFLMFMLYRSAYKNIRDNMYVVVKPQLFDTWGWFLRPLGCIPSTRLEDGGKGFVEKTVQEYKNKTFKLAVSPKGTTNKSGWRSGYYYLRQGLKADIVTCGVDYEKKCIVMGPIREEEDINDLELDDMNDMLKNDISKIVPLYPDHSDTVISRKYDKNKVGLIDWTWFILMLIVIILLIFIVIIIYKIIKVKYFRK